METPPAPALNPASLPPGTVVGRWCVVAWGSRGNHGAIYQVVPVDKEQARPLALKLALLPGDPRFEREAELLLRLRHPSVPRLWEHGDWQHPSGTFYPFLVMEWIDGVPLYDWARRHHPTSQQVLRLLAQLARALQALHAQGSVHRDVKGANVLVRRNDSRAVLTDFGSGRYPEAATLTPEVLPPGTPAYRSPEAWLFSLQFVRDRTARYSAQPADDLYALGVTAYRLVTGKYPELAEPSQDEAGTWHVAGVASPAPLVLNPRVAPQLNALILRMLSVRPEERGTAGELAKALEQAAQPTTPESAQPLFAQEAPPPSTWPQENAATASLLDQLPEDSSGVHVAEPREPATQAEVEAAIPEPSSRAGSPAEFVRLPMSAEPWRPWLMTVAVLLVLVAWAWWVVSEEPVEQPSIVQKEAGRGGQEDGGTAGLGDAASTASTEDIPASSMSEVMAENALPEPLPGQAQPDAKGRCAHKRQVAVNGGCWVQLKIGRDECESLTGQLFKGTCYVPILPRGRRPTSSPGSKP